VLPPPYGTYGPVVEAYKKLKRKRKKKTAAEKDEDQKSSVGRGAETAELAVVVP
jgi:hypothetical protein